MYLEIDEGYQEHRKTVHLCGLMMNPEAEIYPIRLWRWAVRSCPDGNMRTMSPYAIETILRYRLLDGKLYAAMVEAGFIDEMPDGTKRIHNWMERTGGAIARMAKKAHDLQQRRLHVKTPRACDPKMCPICTGKEPARSSDRAGTVPAQNRHGGGDDPPSTDQSSPDKTSLPESPPARAIPAPPAPPRPPRPSGYDLCRWFGLERSAVFPEALSWVIPTGASGKTDAFAARLDDDALADIRPTMNLLWRHVQAGHPRWSDERIATSPDFAFGSWCSRFTELREELHGKTPKVAARAGPSRDPTVGHVKVEAGKQYPSGVQDI